MGTEYHHNFWCLPESNEYADAIAYRDQHGNADEYGDGDSNRYDDGDGDRFADEHGNADTNGHVYAGEFPKPCGDHHQ